MRASRGPMVTSARTARLNARRSTACSKHPDRSHVYAPRPGRFRPSVSTPSTAAKRRSSDCGPRRPQPTHVLTGTRRSRRVARLLCRRHSGRLDVRRDRDLGGVPDCAFGSLRLLGRQLACSERLLDLGDGLLGDGDVVRHGGGDGDRCTGGRIAGDRLVGRDAAVLRPRQGCVRAPLAVREKRGAAAGEVPVAVVLAGEGRIGLLLRELGVGLDVDLPAREARGETRVEPLLADRERELVVRHDDGRVAALVVDVDLAHPRRRERLRDEPRRLGVPRDDVDLVAAELGHDHADARAARPDARADRVDALDVRLDRDLRAVARLACDAADLDEPVGDLGHLELEQCLDQLRRATGEDHLRALRARAHLDDHGLDARALLVPLTVDLLGAGQERLDLAEVDEHVVAVAGLLDDARDDLALAVDVLLVHDRALRLADALLDDLLRGHRGDATEVVRRRVGAVDQVVRHLLPVEVELVVDDQRVLLLARLFLDPLELVDRALTGLVEQARLEIARDVEREDAELTLVVELDRRVARGARRLLVGGEQGVLERGHERARLDALLLLDRPDPLDDLLAHSAPSSSIRLPRTISSTGIWCAVPWTETVTAWSSAATSVPRRRLASAVFSFTVPPIARRKCSGRRTGRSGPGDETSIVQWAL